MSIRVVCPNGHSLKVPDSFAGKAGLCPVCKARVKVPRAGDPQLSEDAILGILGPHESEEGGGRAPAKPAEPKAPVETPLPPKKSCERCNREIAANVHICPYCHTYIANLSEL
jgi:RNA polymerase subunit RPABC4/transcription elongation factor Spt4